MKERFLRWLFLEVIEVNLGFAGFAANRAALAVAVAVVLVIVRLALEITKNWPLL